MISQSQSTSPASTPVSIRWNEHLHVQSPSRTSELRLQIWFCSLQSRPLFKPCFHIMLFPCFRIRQYEKLIYIVSDTIIDQVQEKGFKCFPRVALSIPTKVVWHQSLPSRVTSTCWDNETLIVPLTNRIINVVTHFRGKYNA